MTGANRFDLRADTLCRAVRGTLLGVFLLELATRRINTSNWVSEMIGSSST